MTETSQGSSPLQWKLFIRRRASATQDTPPGRDELKWVANTATLIYGERDALLVDTFFSETQTENSPTGSPPQESVSGRFISPMPIPIISSG